MQNKLGLYFGYSFLQAYADYGNESFSKRVFTGDMGEEAALLDILESLPSKNFSSVNIATRWPEKILEKRMGAEIALIVTDGFQNWPRIRQPALHTKTSRQPLRAEPVISEEFIFGLSERCSADGEIQKKPEQYEIDFLHSKFQLLGVKIIALGFLHSNKNSDNEIFIKNTFEKLGYKVYCSHEKKHYSENKNEVARWWRCVLDAYVAELCLEKKQLTSSILERHQLLPKFYDSLGQIMPPDTDSFYSSQFAKNYSLSKTVNRDSELLYLGLEEFLYIRPDQKSSLLKSEFGPVGVDYISSENLTLQPTSIISPDPWKLFRLEQQQLGFEPGPMFMGKSVTPCLLDLLFLTKGLSELPSLEPLIKKNSKTKINDLFFTFTRETEFEKKLEELLDLMLSTVIKKLATEISDLKSKNKNLIITGPLVPALGRDLQKLLASDSLIIAEEFEHIDAKSIMELSDA